VPFYFGGTSLLIVVSVTMDTVAQVQGYLLAHQYEGLIQKSKLRGRRIERVKMVSSKVEPSARYVNNHGGASTEEPSIIGPSSLDRSKSVS
jgi:hypothetical protein